MSNRFKWSKLNCKNREARSHLQKLSLNRRNTFFLNFLVIKKQAHSNGNQTKALDNDGLGTKCEDSLWCSRPQS